MLNENLADWWLRRITAELRRAKKKFPAPFYNSHEAYAVLLEEVDEFWDNVKTDKDIRDKQEEMVQVAAMALRYLVELGDPELYRIVMQQKALVKSNIEIPEPYGEIDA